jgi:hypothetical protein
VSIPAPAAEKQGFVSGEKHRAMGGEIQESFVCRRMEAAGAPLPPRRWSTRRAVEQLGVAWESSDGIRDQENSAPGMLGVRREAFGSRLIRLGIGSITWGQTKQDNHLERPGKRCQKLRFLLILPSWNWMQMWCSLCLG